MHSVTRDLRPVARLAPPERAARVTGSRWPLVGFVATALILFSCSSASGGDQANQALPSGVGVDVPADQITAFDQCMLDAGFRVSVVHPGYQGSGTWYEWESDLGPAEVLSKGEECRAKFRPYREKTVDELRVIYDRWVGERGCLVELGYQPVAPPSFEKFTADWKTGPWMPVDGLDIGSWSDTELLEAKARCGLEMYDR